MNKLFSILVFGVLTFSIVSCNVSFEPKDTIPECDFSGVKTFTMTDFGLTLPNIQSANVAFHNAFNIGGVIYNLNTLLDTKGDYRYPDNEAAVFGKLLADGTQCKGEKPFKYKTGNPNVSINSVTVPAPSNVGFYGEVTIKAKTDSFREQGAGYNQGFYIRWEVVENDPDNFVTGNIQGEKIPFDYNADMMYIPDIQEPIYMDGNYQLPSEPL
ncbi:MAG: hypothetical protein ABJ092_08530 [Gillisia sp.]